MKSFALVLLVAQAALLQTAYSQCIRSYGPNILASPFNLTPSCGCPPTVVSAPLIQSSSVAASLADTLSLLTVSSLLADTLPLGYTNVIGVPTSPCGCNSGFSPYSILY